MTDDERIKLHTEVMLTWFLGSPGWGQSVYLPKYNALTAAYKARLFSIEPLHRFWRPCYQIFLETKYIVECKREELN